MWPFPAKDPWKIKLPGWAAAAIIISAVSLAFSVGVARWSWLLVNEQISLRRDFMNLKASQEQLNLQYDFWSKQLQNERAALKAK